jgi:two-component sensor histidine kinase
MIFTGSPTINKAAAMAVIENSAGKDHASAFMAGNSGDHYELLLRETNHRCANDLQLVVSLLGLQSRRCTNADARQALAEASDRVAVLARARSAMLTEQHSLKAALQGIGDALESQAEPLSIDVTVDVPPAVDGLVHDEVTTLAIVVNELATNAIKHAFDANAGGHVRIAARPHDSRHVAIIVDDDGLPFPELPERKPDGLGLELVRQLMVSIGGEIVMPTNASKCFEIRVPISAQ